MLHNALAKPAACAAASPACLLLVSTAKTRKLPSLPAANRQQAKSKSKLTVCY
jgi:hypothetical protein